MPKNPMIIGKMVLKNGGSIETEAGTSIASVSSTGTVTSSVGDITSVTAGSGLTGGGASGAVTLAINTASVTATMLASTLDLSAKTVTLGAINGTTGTAVVTKTDDGATGAVITARQVSASPAANDVPGAYVVVGKDDAGNDTTYAQFAGMITSPADGAEISVATVQVQNGTGTPATAATFGHDGTDAFMITGNTVTESNVGTEGSNVTATEYGNGRDHVTVLTFSAMTVPGPTAAAAEGHGYLLYTFPAGVHVHEVTYMSVGLTGGGVCNADTPDVGIGSVIATGAVSLLNGTATFEDYITGQTATNCAGAPTVAGPLGATAGVLTDISLNGAAGTKTVHLNYADTWAGADTLTATGTVVLKWTTLA